MAAGTWLAVLFVSAVSAQAADLVLEGATAFREGKWRLIAAPPIEPRGIAGQPKGGIFVFGGNGRQVAWLRTYDRTDWKQLPQAPIAIEGMSGPPTYGALAFGGRRVAYLLDVGRPAWNLLPPAPFAIRDMAGDAKRGPVVLSRDGRQIAYLYLPKKEQGWQVYQTPFPAQHIAGEIKHGVTIAGGSRLARMTRIIGGGTWSNAPAAPAPVADLAGGQQHGAALLLADGQGVFDPAYEGRWTRLPGLHSRARMICGEGKNGFIVLGERAAAPPPPPPPADTTRPVVEILSPRPGLVRANTVRVEVRARDDRGVAGVRINGADARPGRNGLWSAVVRLQPGQNRIVVQAWDAAGNRAQSLVQLHADWQPPRVVAAEARATVTVRGRVDDPGAKVTIDGVSVRLARDGSFAAQLPAPETGFVTLVAVDGAGNRTVQRIPVR